MEKDYYPAGAFNDPRAPYNEPQRPAEREFNVDVTMTLTKFDTVTTDDYDTYVERDEDDGFPIVEADTEYTNWDSDYRAEHYTILEMLDILKRYVDADIASGAKMVGMNIHQLKHVLADCQGWEEEELIIEER